MMGGSFLWKVPQVKVWWLYVADIKKKKNSEYYNFT